MFTVFTAVMGSLFAVELDGFGATLRGGPVKAFRLSALVLAFLFILAEMRIGFLLATYQEMADKSKGPLRLPLPPGHPIWKHIVRSIMLAPFVLSMIFWLWCLYRFGGEPLREATFG
jgi:hypothetical protein